MRYILDGRYMLSKAEAHRYLQETFGFPAYYGKNLDALYDCLTDLPPTEIYLENVEDAGHFYPVIKHVMQSAKKENRDIRLLIAEE